MNYVSVDFHVTLLWLRAFEIAAGQSPVLLFCELNIRDLFENYRSPYKA